MNLYRWRRLLTKEFLIGYTIITGLIAAGLLIGYIHYKNHVVTRIQDAARQSVVKGEDAITHELQAIEDKAKTLASHLEHGLSNKYEEHLQKYLKENKAIISIGVVEKGSDHVVAWAQRHPYAPVKQIKKITYEDLAKSHKWKDDVFKAPEWNTTYLGPSSDYVMCDYTFPVRSNGDQVDMMLFITYSTEILTDHVLSIQMGKTGYSFVVLPRGQFIIHPFRNYILKEKTVLEHAESELDPGMLQLSKHLAHKKNGEIDYINKKTGQKAWIIYRSIEKTNWVLAGIFFLNELYREVEAPLRHFYIILVLAMLLFALGFVALFLKVYKGISRSLWHYSIFASIFFVIVIGILWHVTLHRSFIPLEETVIVDKPALQDYMHELKIVRDKYHLVPSITVATGMLIFQAQFTGDGTVNFSGIVWQRYKKGVHDHLQRGFIFPDAWGGDNDIEKIYHETKDDEEVIGWKFSSILMQHLDPKRYPLDANYIRLRMWHMDFEKNVILVPDLDGYSFTNPLLLPGLDPAVKFREWDIRRSFFSYTINDYRTNFGVPDASSYDVMPELSFSIGIQRKVFNVLISILFPLLGAAFMLFASLLAFTRDETILEASGFNTLAILAVATALFFTLISLRSSLVFQGLIYLDYFFFALYFMLFAISVISVLFVIDKDLEFIQYKNSLIIKLLYWPFMTASLMLVTLVIFY